MVLLRPYSPGTYPFGNNLRQSQHGKQPLHLLWSDPLADTVPMPGVGMPHFETGGAGHLLAEGGIVPIDGQEEVIPGHGAGAAS